MPHVWYVARSKELKGRYCRKADQPRQQPAAGRTAALAMGFDPGRIIPGCFRRGKPVCDPSGWLSTALHFKGKYEGLSGSRASCFPSLRQVASPNASRLARGNAQFCCFRLKNPPVLTSTNLDSSTNFMEALERLFDYTEKGKKLKERLLTQS